MNHNINSTAAIATHHPLAVRAAEEILQAGGNAIDAAVAAMVTLCVVLPGSVGLGGYGGSMVIYLADQRKTLALDFDSRAPREFSDEVYASDAFARSNNGYLALSTPAIVAGLSTALRDHGTKSWKDVTRFAAELAENGFPMEPDSHKHLLKWLARTDAVSLKALFADGKIPDIGRPWVQKDLGRMLRDLGRDGPESFYQGKIAEQIIAQVRAHGGILSKQDLAGYQAQYVDPLMIDYRGYTVATPPPPSGGITMLQILKTLDRFDLTVMKPWAAPYLHLIVEASKLCWADRYRALGDPDFVKLPVDDLLSDQSADARASELNRRRIGSPVKNPTPSGSHTSNVSVIDSHGNVVSLTSTQGFQFGSGVVIDGLGLVMGHGMSRFDFAPDHPNRPQAGKRMHHNMSPTILLKNNAPFAALGLPGGTKIITVTAQLIVNLIDFHASPKEAVFAPRVHSEGEGPICVSGSMPQDVVDELTKMGHVVERGQSVGGPPNEVAGPANIVTQNGANLSAASSASPDAAAVIQLA